MKNSLFFIPVLLALAACEPTVANRGNMVDQDRLSQVTVGVTDQASVQALLGPPTMIGTFDTTTWYYSGERTKKVAFFDPHVTSQRTLAIAFDETGVVKEVTDVDPTTAKDITPVARKTPSAGHDMTVGEQLLDNFSRPSLPGTLGSQKQPGQIGH